MRHQLLWSPKLINKAQFVIAIQFEFQKHVIDAALALFPLEHYWTKIRESKQLAVNITVVKSLPMPHPRNEFIPDMK